MEARSSKPINVERINQICNSYLSSGRVPYIASVRRPSNASPKYAKFLRVSSINASSISSEPPQVSAGKRTTSSNPPRLLSTEAETVRQPLEIAAKKAPEISDMQPSIRDLPKPINTADDWNLFKDLGDSWSWKVYDEASKMLVKEAAEESPLVSQPNS
jgi:hypothetical protein